MSEYYVELANGNAGKGSAWTQVSERVDSLHDLRIPERITQSVETVRVVFENDERTIDVLGIAWACEVRELLRACVSAQTQGLR